MSPSAVPLRPWLAAWSGEGRGATLLEYAALLGGEPRTDAPACVHRVLASAARSIGECMDDESRQGLLDLLGGLVSTPPTGTAELAFDVRLACWCANRVLPLVPQKYQETCRKSVSATLAWSTGTATETGRDQDVTALWADLQDARTSLTDNAVQGMRAAYYATGSMIWRDGADRAVTCAVRATATAPDAALADFLAALIAEHDRLTGRPSWQTVSDEDLAGLAVLAGLGA